MSDDTSEGAPMGSLDFRGHTVAVHHNERGSWLFPGQIAELMEINAEAQRQSIERQPWSEGWTSVTLAQLPGDSQARQHFLLHERRVPMWIATIKASRLREPARSTVIKWQNEFADVLYEYLKQGGVINPDATFEQIEALHRKIAVIRASEMHAHRRLTDLIAETASDYIPGEKHVCHFFAVIQNVLLYAVSGRIAGELKREREIVCWKGKNGPTKADKEIAKNYLSELELRALEKLVGVFFDLADIRVMFRDEVNLELWKSMLNEALHAAGRPVLGEDRPWMLRSA